MIQQNIGFLEYTYLHRKAFAYLVEELIKDPEDKKEMRIRARWHDLDKSLLYTLIPKSDASMLHRENSPHHMENSVKKIYYDFMEAVIDYECAALTKPDKPRNAFDTVKEFHPLHAKELTEVMEKLGINSSYIRKADEKFHKYMEQFLPVTEEKILAEIYHYISRRPESQRYIDMAEKILKQNNA